MHRSLVSTKSLVVGKHRASYRYVLQKAAEIITKRHMSLNNIGKCVKGNKCTDKEKDSFLTSRFRREFGAHLNPVHILHALFCLYSE